jgi:predicted Rossmann fold nucleotide-binding protein DprA/Smf involved in DNA uptake
MKFTDDEMSIIILYSYIGIGSDFGVKPLSLGEWNKLYDTLEAAKLPPSIVYNAGGQDLKNIGYDQKSIERINKLVDRGAAVERELWENENRGINVITEINKDYPKMLLRKLKTKKPPILFYAGDISLSGKMGIGVVGSRNISPNGVEFTKKLALKATEEKLIIYSGGARGVDTISEMTALNAGGGVVSFITDCMFSRLKKFQISSGVENGRMLLISDQKPDVGFSAGRALNRNKFIYASGLGTFAVESDYNKGGTWNGATEAIKNKWGKVYVWKNGITGNEKLIELGGIPYIMSDEKLCDILNKRSYNAGAETIKYEQMSLSML